MIRAGRAEEGANLISPKNRFKLGGQGKESAMRLSRNSAFLTLVCLGLVLIACAAAGTAQFQAASSSDNWEEFLLTAEIVASRPIGEGVTKPWRLTLQKGDVKHDAAWKNVDETVENRGEWALDSWKSEIAAYRLDKLIGLNLVPPCVEREFAPPPSTRKRKGALSYWTESRMNYLKMQEEKIEFPPERAVDADRMKALVRLWDCLLANADRTQQNILLTADWRTILIDHSRAFQPDAVYAKQLIFGTNGMQKLEDGRPFLIRFVPRAVYDRILALDAKKIRDAVGDYLSDKQIKGIVARVALIRKEIEAMVAQDGESKVFY
jgi:hypothetical protein